MMSEIAIKLDNVSKYYKLYNSTGDRAKEALNLFGKIYHKDFYALKNINVSVTKGEIIGVVGRNGSGKSTLLKIVSSVLIPNAGSVDVNGRVSALLELGSGFNPEFTGLQNIYFYGTIMGFSRKEMEGRVDTILDFAEIGDFIHQPIKTYSSGMKSRLGFAVAVNIEPEILILDEVLSVGDSLFQRKCYAKMEEFFKGGKTVIYVSHNTNSVNELCTRAILLDKGELLMDDDAKTVTEYYKRTLLSNTKNIALSHSVGSNKQESINNKLLLQGEDAESVNNDYYLPYLKSKSYMEYKNYDVAICDARILDSNGIVVNVLRYGEFYDFVIDVNFGINCDDVSFGFEIKDEKGVVITSVESFRMYKNDISYTVNKGDDYTLTYNFQCLYCVGEYYVNFGVSSFGSEHLVLNRIIDVLVFKALNNNSMSNGYVELIRSVEIKNSNEIKRVAINS